MESAIEACGEAGSRVGRLRNKLAEAKEWRRLVTSWPEGVRKRRAWTAVHMEVETLNAALFGAERLFEKAQKMCPGYSSPSE